MGDKPTMVRLVMNGFERVKLSTLWQYFPVDYTYYENTSSENVTCSVRPFYGIGGQWIDEDLKIRMAKVDM